MADSEGDFETDANFPTPTSLHTHIPLYSDDNNTHSYQPQSPVKQERPSILNLPFSESNKPSDFELGLLNDLPKRTPREELLYRLLLKEHFLFTQLVEKEKEVQQSLDIKLQELENSFAQKKLSPLALTRTEIPLRSPPIQQKQTPPNQQIITNQQSQLPSQQLQSQQPQQPQQQQQVLPLPLPLPLPVKQVPLPPPIQHYHYPPMQPIPLHYPLPNVYHQPYQFQQNQNFRAPNIYHYTSHTPSTSPFSPPQLPTPPSSSSSPSQSQNPSSSNLNTQSSSSNNTQNKNNNLLKRKLTQESTTSDKAQNTSTTVVTTTKQYHFFSSLSFLSFF